MENSKGPGNIDPWGTPTVISPLDEKVSSVYTHLLGSATQKTPHPSICISPNTIMIQFLQQDVMIHTIKGLSQIQKMAPTYCPASIALSHESLIRSRQHILGRIPSTVTKARLSVRKEVVYSKMINNLIINNPF